MNARLNGRFFHYPVLIAASSLLFLLNLGKATLWEVDEGRNATAALEMMEAGQWVVPTFNAELRVDKPALLYWCQIAAYRLFGVNEFAARFPSALAALGAVLLAYELARSMFRPATGLLAGLMLGSTPMLCGAARFANPDALLTFFTVLTLHLFWIGHRCPSVAWYACLGVASGFAVLAKGPVGVVLPTCVVFVYVAWERRWRLLFNWGMVASAAAWSLVALPWYVWVAIDTQGNFLSGFLLRHNVGRFLTPLEEHSGSPFYYLGVLVVGAGPWSLLFALTAWCAAWSLVRQPRPRLAGWWQAAADVHDSLPRTAQDSNAAATSPGDDLAAAYRFLWCWLLVYVVFFSAAATKLPNYILSTMVPWSIFTARLLDRWRTGLMRWPAWALPVYFAEHVLLGLGAAAVLLIVSGAWAGWIQEPLLSGHASWAAVGLVPLVAGALAWLFLRRQQRNAATACFVAGGVLLIGVLFAGLAPELNRVKAVRPLVEQSGAGRRDLDLRIGGWQVGHLASLHFYVQRDITHHPSREAALAFLRYQVPVFLFLPAGEWQQLAAAAPPGSRVLAAHRDMYRNQDIVVVTNR